jgi:hypothetical protein
MKWPENTAISIATRQKLDHRIALFLNAQPSNPDDIQEQVATQDLCLDLFAIYMEADGQNEDGFLELQLNLNGINWDTDNPRLAHSQKYINRLFACRLDEAVAYLEALKQHRTEEAQAVVADAAKRNGSAGGQRKNMANKEAIDKALAYCEANPHQFKSKKEAARYCEENFKPVKYSTYYRLLSGINVIRKRPA